MTSSEVVMTPGTTKHIVVNETEIKPTESAFNSPDNRSPGKMNDAFAGGSSVLSHLIGPRIPRIGSIEDIFRD